MISVIIPNYNRSQYLEQALKSVINQSYHDWEALIVDDGSNDDSKSMVTSYSKKDSRIKWLERQGALKGASVCRNLGIETAKGDYIIFLDSDDLLAPHCMQQRLTMINANANLDFSVFKMQFFSETPGDDNRLWNLENSKSNVQRFLNLDAVWQTSGPIWKTKALKSIGGFNPNLQCWQDIDIHVKALVSDLNYKVCYDLPVDCYYRKDSNDSISQSNTNSIKKLESKSALYYHIENHLKESQWSTVQMLLHILISAINGNQRQFYKKFYKDVKEHLTKEDQKKIKRMARIKFYRWDKINKFKEQYMYLKSTLIEANSIGNYTTQDV